MVTLVEGSTKESNAPVYDVEVEELDKGASAAFEETRKLSMALGEALSVEVAAASENLPVTRGRGVSAWFDIVFGPACCQREQSRAEMARGENILRPESTWSSSTVYLSPASLKGSHPG